MTQLTSNVYSVDYKKYCFYTWYANGRPGWTDLVLMIDKFQDRMKPNAKTLLEWSRGDNWEEQANRLDAQVYQAVEERYITEKAKMLARHAEAGREISDLGLDYLRNNGITSQSAALRAVQLGIEIEGEAAQIEKLYSDVSKMEDKKVTKRLADLLGKAKLDNRDDRDKYEQT